MLYGALSWVRWTNQLADDLFAADHAPMKKSKEEFSHQVVLAVDNDPDEEKLANEPHQLIASIIGLSFIHHTTLYYTTLRCMTLHYIG